MMLIMEPRLLRVAWNEGTQSTESIAWNEHEESYKPIMFDSFINSARLVYAGHLKTAGARCLSMDHPAVLYIIV